MHRAGPGALRDCHRERRAGQLAARGRDGQAAREHVPGGEHRDGERARAHVRSAGHRRVGGGEGRSHEALRIHAVLPGSRAGRALHSNRPVLPLVESSPGRLRSAVHRACRDRQRRDAALRRDAGRRCAQHAAAALERLTGVTGRRLLQAQRGRY